MGKKKGKKGKKGPPPPPPTAEDETPTLPIPKDVVQLPSPSCFGNYSANIHTVGKHKFLAIVHQFRGQIVLPEKRAHPHTCWFRAGPPAKAATICISEDGEQTPYDPGFGSVAVPSCETCREIASDTEGEALAPGWYRFGSESGAEGHWLLHWQAPLPTAAASAGSPVRTPKTTSMLRIVHSYDLTHGGEHDSAATPDRGSMGSSGGGGGGGEGDGLMGMGGRELKPSRCEIVLTGGGSVAFTARDGGEPLLLEEPSSMELRALAVLPPIGGAAWQLRALVMFQAWDIIRSELKFASLSPRAWRLVTDALDRDEEAAAEVAKNRAFIGKLSPDWVAYRGLLPTLLMVEAPQDIVRCIHDAIARPAALGKLSKLGASAPGGLKLGSGMEGSVARAERVLVDVPIQQYLHDLRSPCLVGVWALLLLKDTTPAPHLRRQHLCIVSQESGVHVALHPQSNGSFMFYSSQGAAAEKWSSGGGRGMGSVLRIEPNGHHAATSLSLFWRFLHTRCKVPLGAGKYTFGTWLLQVEPATHTAIVLRNTQAGSEFRLNLSRDGGATFVSTSGEGALLYGEPLRGRRSADLSLRGRSPSPYY